MTAPFPTFETFEGRVGETFHVTGPLSDIAMTLTSATTWGAPGVSQRQAFTLEFHGPLAPVLPQAIYRFEHDTIGGIDLFIVPLGPKEGEMLYEVIFA
jgi:hypothetical protein